MKGDFTRFTFQPNKQYTSVLMQQGRLQLDADWNEQMSILAYLNQVQARDMIGASAGTSETAGSFKITSTPDNTDLIIAPGRFYLNGLLCELVRGTEIEVEIVQPSNSTENPNQIRVSSWLVDGREFAKNQWVEISRKLQQETNNSGDSASDNPPTNPTTEKDDTIVKIITEIDPKLQILTLNSSLEKKWIENVKSFNIRRITTYKNQPDYPNSDEKDEDGDGDGEYIVYLDAWQRHITPIEDPSIREVALQVPDTATRTKTVWQVKLLQLKSSLSNTNDLLDKILDEIKSRQEWQQLTGEYENNNQILSGRKVYLTASTDRNSDSELLTSGSYLGNDNRLYRIEVHTSGAIDKATFKWSRENGSIVSAIDSIENNIINLISPIKEIHKLFENGQEQPLPWVEIISEKEELKNEPGTLVQLVKAKPNQLIFNLSKIRGEIPSVTKEQARSGKYKVRRWHDTAAGEILITQDWIDIEEGIKIKFEPGTFSTSDNAKNFYEFKTGDFWIIPARESTQSIEWSQDGQKRWQKQPPQGIYHQYTPLALVKKEGNTFKPGINDNWDRSDLCIKFPTLVNCLDKRVDFIEGALGIGFRGEPQATLHVQGNKKKQPDNTEIDLPIAKFDKNDGTTQFIIDPQGNIGIGTEADTNTKLNIKGNTIVDGTIDIKNQATFRNGITLDNTTGATIRSTKDVSLIADNGGNLTLKGNNINLDGNFQLVRLQFERVGIGIAPPNDPIKLQVNGGFKVGDTNSVTFSPPTTTDPVRFTTTANQGYQFDKGISIESGDITLPSEGKIKSSDSLSLSSKSLSLNSISNDGAKITLKDKKITFNGDLEFQEAQFNRVGINTNTPADNDGTKLHIDGDLKISNGDNFLQVTPPNSPSNNPVKFFTTTQKGYLFNQQLEINGDVKIDKNISIKETATIGSKIIVAKGNISLNNTRENKIVSQNKLTLQCDEIHLKEKVLIPKKLLIGDPENAPPDIKLYVEGSTATNDITANELKVFSSQTFKDNITNLSSQEVGQILQGLNPVKFTYKADRNQTLHLGFIAEEVPDVIASSDRQAINPMDIIATLTKVVKDHQETIASLSKVIEEQKEAIAILNQRVKFLEEALTE